MPKPRGPLLLWEVLGATEGTSAQQCAPKPSRAVNDICSRSGVKPSAMSVEEIRGGQTADLSSRGLLSLDAEATRSAKRSQSEGDDEVCNACAGRLGYSSLTTSRPEHRAADHGRRFPRGYGLWSRKHGRGDRLTSVPS